MVLYLQAWWPGSARALEERSASDSEVENLELVQERRRRRRSEEKK